jgi:hypothetical protein
MAAQLRTTTNSKRTMRRRSKDNNSSNRKDKKKRPRADNTSSLHPVNRDLLEVILEVMVPRQIIIMAVREVALVLHTMVVMTE